jgi:hypothetical protein
MEMGEGWVVHGPSDGVVGAWSIARLPFEPSGPLLEFRAELRRAVRELVTGASSPYGLTATYCSASVAFVDAENVLLYNVGT